MPGSAKGRRIVTLWPSMATQDALQDWAKASGFDLAWSYSGWPQLASRFQFHLTVAVSSNALDMDVGARPIEPLTLTASGFKVLGVDRKVPTIAIELDAALSALRAAVEKQGVKPTFPDFEPHMSLSYLWDGAPALDTLAVPPFPLVFDYLAVAEFVEKTPVWQDGTASTGVVICDAAVKVTFGDARQTKDGYVVAEARCARTGIQNYLGIETGRPDLETVRVYRPADEVFAPAALQSYAYRPVTVDHPREGVSAENWRDTAVGNTGAEVVRDGDFVRVPLILMDAKAIRTMKAGTAEISMGYDCTLDWTPGTTPDGQAYDAVQRNLRMNHLALVKKGRAGAECRVGDSATPVPSATSKRKSRMKTLIVDGISHEVADATADLITGLQTKLKTAEAATAAADAKVVAADAARDAAAGEKAALAAQVPTADQLDAMVSERTALVETAKRLVADFDPKGKSAADIRAAVVKAKLGDVAVINRSADYVQAAFDTLAGAKNDPVADALRDGTGAQPVISARDKHLAEQAKAWSK